MIELGDIAKDLVSGLEGVVTERREYLNGCIQFVIIPPMKKGSDQMPSWCLDEEQLVVVKKKAVKVATKEISTGGPAFKVT